VRLHALTISNVYRSLLDGQQPTGFLLEREVLRLLGCHGDGENRSTLEPSRRSVLLTDNRE